MDRKYFLKHAIEVARLSRLIAKAIDLSIVVIFSLILYPVGLILGIVYIALSDGFSGGQSIGKRLMGFSVISLEDGQACSYKQSLVRNLPLLIPLIFAIIPFWGWVIGFVLGVGLVGLELYFLYNLDSGHRLGDVMADTSVMGNDGNYVGIKNRKTSWFKSTETV